MRSTKTLPAADQTTPPRDPETLHLVSCVARKRGMACEARDLYLSPWFIKARAFVERRGGPWLILSAEHGLLTPDQVVSPYDRTLTRTDVNARRSWAHLALSQFDAMNVQPQVIVILAGARYREFLVPAFTQRGLAVRVPMAGLPIGRQLAWLQQAP